ncbi:MAG: toll/interleukin-1 receptor domain-containing protein, partial [Burkholderiales bacterium]|nr:toll/interleukin-1 receptor domain-containing protein [Burkholderiales bacterium]
MATLALYFTNYMIILSAGFVKAKVLTDRGQRWGSRYLRRRAVGVTSTCAALGKKVARARGEAMPGYSIFISYAHEDEAFKNALTQQLKGLKRQRVIDPWDDRCIDGGDAWRAEIDTALDGCHLALLLVSPAFIASDFINTVELSRLLERRERDEIRIVPIILRPCAWKYEQPIESLQARPKNGKPIITFRADDGSRDQAWLEIVEDIARWAKEAPQAARFAPSGEEPIASLLARLGEALAA